MTVKPEEEVEVNLTNKETEINLAAEEAAVAEEVVLQQESVYLILTEKISLTEEEEISIPVAAEVVIPNIEAEECAVVVE